MIRISKDKILFSIFLIISFIGYFLTERKQEFSFPQFYIAFFYSLICTFIFFKKKDKQNYFDFDTLFILVLFTIGYLASFSYGKVFYKSLFFFEFDYRYLNSGTWVFTIGLISYYLGGIGSIRCVKTNMSKKIYPTKPVFISLLFIILVFIGMGGLTFFQATYQGENVENGLVSYLIILMIVNSIVLTSIEFINYKRFPYYKFHWIYFIVIGFTSFLIMAVGNRTAASQLLLPIIGLYTLFYRPIRLKAFVLSIIPLFVLMYVIQIARSGENVSFQLESPMLMARDLTIPHRATFEAMAYADENGFTYGKSMSAGVIGLVPGVAGLIIGNSREFGSAETLTTYTYTKLKTPPEYQIGLGTNVIGDIYLSFGCFGVSFFMWLLGFVVKKSEENARTGSLLWTIVFSGLMANSVFLARASYSHPLRYVVWGIVFTSIYFLCYRSIIRQRKDA